MQQGIRIRLHRRRRGQRRVRAREPPDRIGRHRVLLLEAGGEDDDRWIHIPLGYGKHFRNPKVNWLFASEPDEKTGSRAIAQPRGKVLGGTSSINGMVYVRGQHEDYDDWRDLGNAGLGLRGRAAVLPQGRGQPARARTSTTASAGRSRCPIRPTSMCCATLSSMPAEACGYPRNPDSTARSRKASATTR